MAREYELVRLAEREDDHLRQIPSDFVEAFMGAEGNYEHVTAIDKRDVEPLVEAAREAFETSERLGLLAPSNQERLRAALAPFEEAEGQ